LIKKKNNGVELQFPLEKKMAGISYVDVTTGENPPMYRKLTGVDYTLQPFSVAIISLKE
jgi:hypothetical protein